MSVINTVIQKRSFEIVRDRIAEILSDELNNQALISYNPDLKANVWIERVVPFDHTELPAVNVILPKGNFDGQTARQTNGAYLFEIQCYNKGISSDGVNGDTLSMIKLHRLIGVCQSILEDARYKTLGFAPPFIMNRHFEDMTISDPQNHDAISISHGKLTFSVRLPETFDLVQPLLLAGYKTIVELYLTARGYLWLSPSNARVFDFTFDNTYN